MNPRPRVTGIAGILAGAALAAELTFFMSSGWSPEKFADPAAALALLREGGAHLRAASAFGAIGLVLTTALVAGLAARLREKTPTRAAATLYFGIIGITGHGLVPLALWVGVPSFVVLATRDQQAVLNSWFAFQTILAAAQGVGSLFLGLSMLATGWAAVSQKSLPVILGWVGVVGGAATILGLLAVVTPVAAVAQTMFFPALLLTIVFRGWAGWELWKGEEQETGERR